MSSETEYFFLSEDCTLDGGFLEPRVPENRMTKNGYEDNETPRVCFAPTVNQALMALSHRLGDKLLYVYRAIDVENAKIYHPTKSQVPDVDITNEVWFLNRTKIEYIGVIRVKDALTGFDYTYDNGRQKATLWSWDYTWVSKIK